MCAADPIPPAAQPPAGAVFIPTHGVELEGDRILCHGLVFLRLDGQTWSTLEANWMRDQELDDWTSRDRVFAVHAYTGEVLDRHAPAFSAALAAYGEVVSAARLTAPGTWIDAEHVAAVARSNNGINVRLVGSERPRLWSAVFGEPRKVRGRRREWGDRVECRPVQYHLPHGPAYALDAERAQLIERVIASRNELLALAPHHGWWPAHRAFERGHDLFLPRRQRLTALFAAFEAVFGPFRREPKDPGIGAAVATLLERTGWETSEPARYVETVLRPARNQLAHGSDHAATIDFAAVEENLNDILRSGLGYASAWIRGRQQADGPLPPGPARSLAEFQRFLGRSPAADE